MPLVSVIIPCYNQGRFLGDAVRSALQQTMSDVEVIVVDDGSTDETAAVAKNLLSDPRVRLVRQHNRGLPAARNRGIDESQGRYLNFLDADDWLAPSKLEVQARILEDNAEYALTYCDIATVYDGVAPGPQFAVGASRRCLTGDIFVSLLLGGYFPPHTVLLRRSVLDAVGYFDPELGGAADYDLWLRIAGAGFRAYYVDSKLAYYRRHSANMSSDCESMRCATAGALLKAARLFPEKVAQGVDEIARTNQDLWSANCWLDQQVREQREWIQELERGKEWLEGQCHNWQRAAQEREAALRRLETPLPRLARAAWRRALALRRAFSVRATGAGK